MIPPYQDKNNLDDTNRAKKRVLKNLQRSFTTPQVPTDLKNDAHEKYTKLIDLFNTSLSLLDESIGFTEDSLLYSHTRLNTTLSKIPPIYRQVQDILKTFEIDYMSPDEVSSLETLYYDNAYRATELGQGIQNLHNILRDDNLISIDRLYALLVSEMVKVDTTIVPMLNNHNLRQNNYVPQPVAGEIGVRGSGGYRVLDYKRMR